MFFITFVTIGFILTQCFISVESIAPLKSVVVFERGEGGYYCHKIPYLIRLRSNVLLAFAEGRGKLGRSSCDDFSGTDLVMKRSFNDGVTWSSLSVVYTNSSDTVFNVVGNAAPVQDKYSNRVWLPFCVNNEEVFITYSDDAGETWATPTLQSHLVLKDWDWIGLGPPSGIQLSTGRILIPAYHTIKWKGDGCDSRGHTIISDDYGLTWYIGNYDFGYPYLANECQAVELSNGSVLINARTLTNNRIQTLSNDGGINFESPYVVDGLTQPFEGCEGSIVRDSFNNVLYFSDPYELNVIRMNMTIHRSFDDGLNWEVFKTVDRGAVAYSALSVRPEGSGIEILYERSDNISVVFDPDQIVYWKITF